jgi:hypothetical protein
MREDLVPGLDVGLGEHGKMPGMIRGPRGKAEQESPLNGRWQVFTLASRVLQMAVAKARLPAV